MALFRGGRKRSDCGYGPLVKNWSFSMSKCVVFLLFPLSLSGRLRAGKSESHKRNYGFRFVRHAKYFFFVLLIGGPLFSQRIVTLAPAITEIVYALGKGDQIVGNTRFCDFPAAAQKIPKVGGLTDFNLEVLVSLQPDLVILYPELYEKVKFLKFRLNFVIVNHISLGDLFSSIQTIAESLNVPDNGLKLIGAIQKKLNAVKLLAGGKKRVNSLLIAGRDRSDLRNIYIVGRKDYLNEILEVAGGHNVYQGEIAYPSVSIESIVWFNPDWIIELSATFESIGESEIMNLWRRYRLFRAVQGNHIYFVRESYWLRPGPRVGMIAESVYRLFHHD
jgi:iron complex transport system substrate-binding protein